MKTELYAFWPYDDIRGVLGGEVTKIYDDGSVETEQFGVGYSFKPIAYLPQKEGAKLCEDLKNLKASYQAAINDVNTHYKNLRNKLLPFKIN